MTRFMTTGGWTWPASQRGSWKLFLLTVLLAATHRPVVAQIESEEPDPRIIDYFAMEGLANPVARLQQRLAAGKTQLERQPTRGYLDALLKELHVPVSSQVLVFSKTSSQSEHTSPQTPRAIYFSDDVYVAWVPGGAVIDLAAQDQARGTIFYTLEQHTNQPPRFARPASCLQCHLGPKTLNVPGLLVRSTYTAADGTPLAQVPGFVNGHNSPLEQRWGGWYVTGTHADTLHLGNIFAANPSVPEAVDASAGANITNLATRFDTSRYLSMHSDLAALLVLEHEMRMHNLITRANYETRYALAERARVDVLASNPSGPAGDWPPQRVRQAGEMLLEYMLFRNEAPLKGPVSGSARFAAEFAKGGPHDSQGRSLRQLDLQKRLLRFPCSFLVYSRGFDALSQEIKEYLWKRLAEILTGRDRSTTYAGMSGEDRQAVLEILRDTKPDFASWLKAPTTPD
jgi:hypothetical protein